MNDTLYLLLMLLGRCDATGAYGYNNWDGKGLWLNEVDLFFTDFRFLLPSVAH